MNDASDNDYGTMALERYYLPNGSVRDESSVGHLDHGGSDVQYVSSGVIGLDVDQARILASRPALTEGFEAYARIRPAFNDLADAVMATLYLSRLAGPVRLRLWIPFDRAPADRYYHLEVQLASGRMLSWFHEAYDGGTSHIVDRATGIRRTKIKTVDHLVLAWFKATFPPLYAPWRADRGFANWP
jgi:hypothetical protein